MLQKHVLQVPGIGPHSVQSRPRPRRACPSSPSRYNGPFDSWLTNQMGNGEWRMAEGTLSGTIGYLLARVCKAHHFRVRELLHEIGLYRGQQFVLCALWREEGLTHSELAERLSVHPATVSNALKRMERAGFLERRPDPVDQRVSRVYLTPRGARSRKMSSESGQGWRGRRSTGSAKRSSGRSRGSWSASTRTWRGSNRDADRDRHDRALPPAQKAAASDAEPGCQHVGDRQPGERWTVCSRPLGKAMETQRRL